MELAKRISARKVGYDYSLSGTYFVTICTKDRVPYFGFVKNGIMCLNEIGAICSQEIVLTGKIRPNVKIHEYIVMPDHIHILMEIYEFSVGACGNTPALGSVDLGALALDIPETEKGALPHPPTGNYPNQSLGSIIGNIKSRVTKYANQSIIPFGWQRSYHDHIVLTDHEFYNIQNYIINNPRKLHQPHQIINKHKDDQDNEGSNH